MEPKRAECLADERFATDKAQEAGKLKASCEADLASAMPALDAATKALDTLKKDDITFLKQLKKPPAIIKLVMHGVCLLLGEKAKRKPDQESGKMVDDWWEPSLRLIGDSEFLNRLKKFDRDNVDPKRMEKIRTEFETLPEFTPVTHAMPLGFRNGCAHM